MKSFFSKKSKSVKSKFLNMDNTEEAAGFLRWLILAGQHFVTTLPCGYF